MRITEAARRLGTSARMLRYREDLGLLPQVRDALGMSDARGAAHRQPRGQLADRRGPVVQQFQDPSPHRLAQRVEHRVRSLVTHRQRLL